MKVVRTSLALLALCLAMGEAAAQYEKAHLLDWLQKDLREGARS